jgi:hypothetical protein
VGNKKAKKRKSPQFVVQIKVVVQYSRKNWAIVAQKKEKKRLSPQFVVQIKVVGQYLRKNGDIFAIYCSGKIFLTPKMVQRFWRRGGGGGRRYKFVPKKFFFGSGRGKSENYELKAPTTSRFLII